MSSKWRRFEQEELETRLEQLELWVVSYQVEVE